MSTAFQGDASFASFGYVLISEDVQFDRFTGRTWTQVYEGTAASLNALSVLYGNAGGRTSLSTPPGGKATLSVVWSRDPGSNPLAAASPPELPVDNWTFTSEPYQISLFKKPEVQAEAKGFLHTATTSTNVTTGAVTKLVSPVIYKGAAAYRKLLEDAVAAGEEFPFPSETDLYPYAVEVFRELCRGSEYWETKRPVIRRQRTYSDASRITPTPISLYTPVYTRSGLISSFSIPSFIASQIPADPSTPPPPDGCVWAWHEKQSSQGYSSGSRKVEESREWDFAAWSTKLYPVIS